jgi:hypothetical protein
VTRAALRAKYLRLTDAERKQWLRALLAQEDTRPLDDLLAAFHKRLSPREAADA